jgi:hypothetical protein
LFLVAELIKRSNGKTAEGTVNFCSCKALSKVLGPSIEKLKAKEPIKHEQIRQELWSKPWVIFAKNLLKSKVCGGIFG